MFKYYFYLCRPQTKNCPLKSNSRAEEKATAVWLCQTILQGKIKHNAFKHCVLLLRETGLKPFAHNRSLSRRGTKQPFRLFDGGGPSGVACTSVSPPLRACSSPLYMFGTKKQALACLFLLVRGTGLEPTRNCFHKNLNLTRLPISPSSHK